MNRRIIGIILVLLGALAAFGELYGIDFPTARWFFSTSRDVPLLKGEFLEKEFLWFGWLSVGVLGVVGVCVCVCGRFGGGFSVRCTLLFGYQTS